MPRRERIDVWRTTPLYFVIYNILSAKESISVDELIEQLRYVEPYKEGGISKAEVMKALLFLELNGLIHVRRSTNDIIVTMNRTPIPET